MNLSEKINAVYYLLNIISISVFFVFIYLAYIVYISSVGTPYYFVTFIMLAPVMVSVILEMILLVSGKDIIKELFQ